MSAPTLLDRAPNRPPADDAERAPSCPGSECARRSTRFAWTPPPTRLPIRTLWRTVFDLELPTMATQFFRGDAADGAPRYSAELEFAVPAPQRC
jgi:hypothetical protein